MKLFYIAELCLISLSCLAVFLLIIIQLWLPHRFLRHPGQLFFISSVFQLVDILRNYTIFYGIHSDNDLERLGCAIIAFIANFCEFMQFTYLAFLSYEIILKLNSMANNKYNLRCKLYHILASFVSCALSILIFIEGEYGKDEYEVCSIIRDSIGDIIYIIYISTLLPIMWLAIIWTFIKIRTNKTRSLSLVLVVICYTITFFLGRLVPKYLHITSSRYESYYKSFAAIINNLGGIIVCMARLMNKKLKFDIKERFILYKLKRLKVSPKKKITDGELIQLLYGLIDEESNFSIAVNDFSGDLFDNITKKVLAELLMLSTTRFKNHVLPPTQNENIIYRFTYQNYSELYLESNQKNILSLVSSSLKLKEYSVLTFFSIRTSSGIDSEDLYISLSNPENYQIIKNLSIQPGGKSRSIVLITKDQRFVIKTITDSERKFLINEFLDFYSQRCIMKNSRLVRIFGLFKAYPSKQSFVIMENVVIGKDEAVIFDLKGSEADRWIDCDSAAPPRGVVLKDMNFKKFNQKITLNETDKKELVSELVKDFQVLATCDIMDYSLLLAFYKDEPDERSRFIFKDDSGNYVGIGIIDILEQYGITKAGEEKIKKMFIRKVKLSVASPDKYYMRMLDFIEELFI